GQAQAGQPVLGAVHRVALDLQVVGHVGQDVAVVLDQEEAHEESLVVAMAPKITRNTMATSGFDGFFMRKKKPRTGRGFFDAARGAGRLTSCRPCRPCHPCPAWPEQPCLRRCRRPWPRW